MPWPAPSIGISGALLLLAFKNACEPPHALAAPHWRGLQGGTCVIVGDDDQLASEIGEAAERAIGCKVLVLAYV